MLTQIMTKSLLQLYYYNNLVSVCIHYSSTSVAAFRMSIS